MLYRFIRSHAKEFGLQKQFNALSVSSSGYYDWLRGKTHSSSEQKQQKEQQIISTFKEHATGMEQGA